MTDWSARETGGIVYLERPGSGPVLVLLHGIGSNASSFAPLVSHLPADFRIIAWNAPGYLGSAPLPQDWPVARDYANAFAGLAERLALPRFTLLGHSLGALIGGAFAATQGKKLNNLILASPALGHGMEQNGALSPASQARIDDLTSMGAKSFAAARAPRLVFQPEAHARVLGMVRDGMAQVSMPGYGQAARMLASGRLLDDAARLAVPTDVITGIEDIVTPPEGARRLHAALKAESRGRLVELNGTGHAIYQQDPMRFAQAIADAMPAA